MTSSSAPRTARDHARLELTRAILASARKQLAEVGPAALSVRAVARDLGMASSATYRYFRSRDDLLTALLIEAYDELGGAVEHADRAIADRGDLGGRWRAVCNALRGWAVANPHEYALLYGSPVPGYAAPETTVPAASRIPLTLLALTADAQAADRQLGAPPPGVTPAEVKALGGIRELTDFVIGDARLVRSLMAWATLFGHISLELFGHMHRGILDYDAHFAQVVNTLAADLGLD
ncbi:MAG TPA: TetR/AcrR family transcriptional regulator [Nocardioidaceae bacterium]|nr:TetR/AcrR family transcriptional regulator [Nocardioidaceae bacterium]